MNKTERNSTPNQHLFKKQWVSAIALQLIAENREKKKIAATFAVTTQLRRLLQQQ